MNLFRYRRHISEGLCGIVKLCAWIYVASICCAMFYLRETVLICFVLCDVVGWHNNGRSDDGEHNTVHITCSWVCVWSYTEHCSRCGDVASEEVLHVLRVFTWCHVVINTALVAGLCRQWYAVFAVNYGANVSAKCFVHGCCVRH